MATASSATLRTTHWSSRVTEARGFQPPATQFSVDSASSSSAAAVVLVPGSSFTPPSEEYSDASSDRYPSEVVGFSSSSSSSSSTVVMSSLHDSIGETRHDSLDNNGASSNADKKQAWGKPLNDSSEVGAPVMGAIWPSLGESIASLNSSSSSDSLKSLTDGSLFPLKGPGPASSSQRQVANDMANPSSSNNHVLPKRQRSMKRGGGSTSNSNVSDNGVFFQPQQPPQGVVMESESNNSGKIANAPAESSSSNHMPEVGGQMGHFGSHCGNEQQRGHFGPQSHNGNNHHQQQRNTFRRVNGGPHSRGDGYYHQSHVGSRQHDRGNHKWNPNRNFGSRDSRMQPHRFVPRGFIQPPTHGPSVFRPPPFGNPIHYHDAASSLFYVPAPPIDSMRGVPMVMPIPPSVCFPASQLHAKIVKQIDYYFSNENLIKDIYLRQKMDNEGWVSIELIAGFKKVMELTNSIRLIVEALQTSTIVEVQGNKIRKRNDWARWVMPPSNQYSAVPRPQSHGRSSHVMLATQLERVSLDANKLNSNFEGYVSSSSSGELNHQAHSTTKTTIYPGDEV